jgi:SAM-dependent methyltransferase
MTGGAAAYYDRIASSYDAEIDTAHNRAVRECFWRCAESVLLPSSRILDFGAGTGIDAGHFAALGHFVAAYDNSEGMLGVLRQRCAEQMKQGSVAAVGGSIDEASAVLNRLAPFDAMLSNFAVFSTIDDLEPVFAFFSRLLRKGGLVLVLIQNPWDSAQLGTRAFWKSLLASPFTGSLKYDSEELGRVCHHTPGQILRAASRDFVPSARTESALDRVCFGRGSHFKLVELTRR